ncbi:MAG: hypothetical protein JWN70_2400 [Planctomycetaceae bacterium]|nr:hypothetical protein [Planctomycetaceae bacterium]
METESPPVLSFDSGQAATRHLKVPRTDGAWLMLPSSAKAVELVQQNLQALTEVDQDVQGCTLSRLREWTREAVFKAACAYTGTWTSALPIRSEDAGWFKQAPWIVGGHQPTLFHPGVWGKNFALGRLARKLSGVSLNLVVDNDTMASQIIKVPRGTVGAPQVVPVPFDSSQLKQPWEDVTVQDRQVFESFGQRVTETLRGWHYEPLITDFWPRVVAHQNVSRRVADGFTAARNQCELDWGVGNIELPLSHLCQLPPFLWFVSHILAQLPRFWAIYNKSVREYRHRNGIHSTSHPVPELTQNGDWLESPFWVWRAGDQRRSRLFARRKGDLVELAVDAQESLGQLPLDGGCDAQQGVARLQELQAAGLHLRTRALTTTLFSRVCLADLFVHGIGGAKYDEITDDLIEQFWELPVPRYWTVSGTLQLPLGSQPVTQADLDQQRRNLWDLQWNPARALAGSEKQTVRRLCAEFQSALARPAKDLLARRSKHRELSSIKAGLSEDAREQIPAVSAQIDEIARQLAANRILHDREYSYVLYPAEKLRDFLTADGR